MKYGPKKDAKWKQILRDSASRGQDSEYLPYLVEKMQNESGDYLSGIFKTEESRKLGEELGKINSKMESLSNERFKLSNKTFKSANDSQRLFEIEERDGELLSQYKSSFGKFCAQVLKDMRMPVDYTTMNYIYSVIVYD